MGVVHGFVEADEQDILHRAHIRAMNAARQQAEHRLHVPRMTAKERIQARVRYNKELADIAQAHEQWIAENQHYPAPLPLVKNAHPHRLLP